MYKLLHEEALNIYEYKQIKEILASKMFSLSTLVVSSFTDIASCVQLRRASKFGTIA